MVRELSENLQFDIASDEIQMRMLVTIFLDDITFYLCANETGNITFAGQEYTAVNIKRASIPNSAQGNSSDERIQLTLADPSATVAQYVMANGNKLNNRKCLIQEVSLSHLDNPADIVTVFDGVMDHLRLGMGYYIVDVIRSIGTYNFKTPYMTYNPTCQWKKLGDIRCGYAGGETHCDRTVTRCKELNNIENFGGHPSIPAEMVISSG